MKLSTKSITSLLTAVKKAAKGSYAAGDVNVRKLERILRRHDRKGNLRASVLGVDAATYRKEQRRYSLEELIKKYGFKDLVAYFQALYGRLRYELRCRGWSPSKLQRLEMTVS